MAQDRKVFVGGVPQDLNQDDLYAIFSEYAGVKKAWLQKCRTSDDGSSNANPPQNHRGFGFVIFHDAHAIDEILGSAPSRFILLRNGTKLEVKRALSSNKMSGPQGNLSELSEQPQAAAARGAGRGAQTQPPLISQGPPSRAMPAPAGPTRAAAGGRPLTTTPWAGSAAAAAGAATLGDDTILRQLSLMHGAGYSVPSQGAALSAAAAAMASAPLGVNSVAYAQPHATGPAAPGQQQTATHPAAEQGGRHPLLRNAIMQFYHEHRPEKLTERDFVDFICNVYEGREQELDEALRQKYGIGLQLGQQQPLLSQQVHQAVREQAKASAELVSRQRAAAASAAAAAAAAAGVPGGFQDPAYAGLQEAWLQAGGPAAAAAAAATAAAAAAVAAQPQLGQQQRSPVLGPWIDPAIADAYIGGAAFGAAAATGAHHDLRFHDADSPSKIDPEGPDFSWIDQIVGDESLEISEEVARAIVNKSATKHRTELLQTAVW